jgi:hypothetical protein
MRRVVAAQRRWLNESGRVGLGAVAVAAGVTLLADTWLLLVLDPASTPTHRLHYTLLALLGAGYAAACAARRPVAEGAFALAAFGLIASYCAVFARDLAQLFGSAELGARILREHTAARVLAPVCSWGGLAAYALGLAAGLRALFVSRAPAAGRAPRPA